MARQRAIHRFHSPNGGALKELRCERPLRETILFECTEIARRITRAVRHPAIIDHPNPVSQLKHPAPVSRSDDHLSYIKNPCILNNSEFHNLPEPLIHKHRISRDLQPVAPPYATFGRVTCPDHVRQHAVSRPHQFVRGSCNPYRENITAIKRF